MGTTAYLPKEKVKDVLKAWKERHRVFVPVLADNAVVFQHFEDGLVPCLERPANASPKGVIFPQCEELFTFRYRKDPDTPDRKHIELQDSLEFPPTILFGARPCDAKGFTIIDRVFIDTDLADPYYKGRREKTAIVTLSCNTPYTGCFCTTVGGGPADKAGADVLITDLGNGFFAEALTDKGETLLSQPFFEKGDAQKGEAEKVRSACYGLLKQPFTPGGPQEKGLSHFNEDTFWREQGNRCISCGACTYLCPTCYCFNVTDEMAAQKGERIRTWDACMFHHFTLEASGHNPRTAKFDRLRNRVGHKFAYYPKTYDGVIACSGCGRCIRFCPVSISISGIVASLMDEAPTTNPQGGIEEP